MKAAVYDRYGPPEVLRITEVEQPVPKDNEVLIQVRAASVNPLDRYMMRGKPLFIRATSGGFFSPKREILGCDIAGRVEAAGKNAKQFQPGDEVFGASSLGGFAEYVCAVEDRLALKPANLSFEEAAAVPVAAVSALQGLRDKGKIQPGNKVLVDGASGGVGTFAVQIAKAFGAEVTAVCSTRKIETARSLGADHVIDYTREDFTRSGQRYDLILAANARHSIFDYRRVLSAEGIFVMVGGGGVQILQMFLLAPFLSRIGKRKLDFCSAKISQKDLVILKGLLEAGKVVPFIDRRYPLSELMEAVRYLEEGHAKGKVVILMEANSGKK